MALKHKIEEVVLKNGARGLFVHVPGASVFCYELCFRAGNEYVAGPDVQQTAHLLEHMLAKTCKGLETAEAFSREFTKNGAYSNATTWQTNMVYEGNCADMEWDRVLGLQLRSISEPILTEESLRVEKGNVREELTGQLSNHPRTLWQYINRSLGDSIALDEEKIASIDAVTLGSLDEHWRRTHTQSNFHFCIVGDMSGKRAKLKSMFENWQLPKGNGWLAPEQHVYHRGETVSITRNDEHSIEFIFAMTIPRRLDQTERWAMSMLTHILTGTFHSRIYGVARDKGYCYDVSSGAGDKFDGTSDWSFQAQVTKEQAPKLLKLIARELLRVRDGDISEKELDETRQYAYGVYQKSYQSIYDLMCYSSDYFFDDSYTAVDENIKLIDAIRRDTIVRLAREFIDSLAWTYGEIGPVSPGETEARRSLFSRLKGEV